MPLHSFLRAAGSPANQQQLPLMQQQRQKLMKHLQLLLLLLGGFVAYVVIKVGIVQRFNPIYILLVLLAAGSLVHSSYRTWRELRYGYIIEQRHRIMQIHDMALPINQLANANTIRVVELENGQRVAYNAKYFAMAREGSTCVFILTPHTYRLIDHYIA